MSRVMQELTFVEARRIEFHERAMPAIEGDGQALVRPLAVARCDLDVPIANGVVPVPGPFPLGHECVAEVIAIGPAVSSVKPGDRVVVPFQISCGACERCSRAQTASCTAVPAGAAYGLGALGGGPDFGGALSDVLRVPFADAMLVKLPEGADPVAAAALGDNALDGFRTVAEPLEREPGAGVLVAGGGAASVGLYAVAAAKALGAGEVVYVDRSKRRAAIAEKLGARVVVVDAWSDSIKAGRFPITVDATVNEDGLRFALRSVTPNGTCTSVGIYFGDVALPLLSMYMRGVQLITGRVDARKHLPAAAKLAATGAFDLASVATDVVDWADAPRVWAEPSTKLVIRRSP